VIVKPKYKIAFSSFLLAVILFAAVPKTYIHALLGHTHDAIESASSGLSFSNDQNTKDCNFEKFDTPVYYTVFKFILNFLPVKEHRPQSFFYHQDDTTSSEHIIPPLRGPPSA
jgi:hypothetical protein